jgi:hypothetical protein
MTLATYTDLLSALSTYAVRADQAANWPTAVALAEARLNRLLSARQMVTTVAGVVTGATAALPADFNGAKALRLADGDNRKLEPVSVDRMDELKARPDVAGEPVFYAIRGSDLEVYPEPSTGTGYQLTYYADIPALASAPGGSNWLIAAHPDAYLYASLVHFGIMAEDQRLQAWEQALEEIVQEIGDNDAAAVSGDRLTPQPNMRTP